jgi:hypothetical protein
MLHTDTAAICTFSSYWRFDEARYQVVLPSIAAASAAGPVLPMLLPRAGPDFGKLLLLPGRALGPLFRIPLGSLKAGNLL